MTDGRKVFLGLFIVAVNLLLGLWFLSGVGSVSNCGTDDACQTGSTIGVGIILFVSFIIDGILAVIWFVSRTPGDAVASGSLRRCPHCAEGIQWSAKVCRYCGREVAPTATKWPAGNCQNCGFPPSRPPAARCSNCKSAM